MKEGGSGGGGNIQETGKFMMFQHFQGVNYSNSFTCHMATVRVHLPSPAGKECIEFAIPLDGRSKDSRYTE